MQELTTTTLAEGAIVATVDEQGTIKPIVIMLDEPLHNEANGYRCTDHTCPLLQASARTTRAITAQWQSSIFVAEVKNGTLYTQTRLASSRL